MPQQRMRWPPPKPIDQILQIDVPFFFFVKRIEGVPKLKQYVLFIYFLNTAKALDEET